MARWALLLLCIGMTKADLISTVATSGTTNFLEATAEGGNANLIAFRRLDRQLAANPKCLSSQTRCHVFVVVDMQKDYCGRPEGTGTKSYCARTKDSDAIQGNPDLRPEAAAITEALNGVKWDLVVFTQDWLHGDGFAEAGTEGAEIIDEIRYPKDECVYHGPTELQPSQKCIRFTKDLDDWMNEFEPGSDPEWIYHHKEELGKRHFALTDETLPYLKGKPAKLKDIFAYYGFEPQKTTLHVAGTESRRCVLKGMLHAKYDGFDVQAYDPGIAVHNLREDIEDPSTGELYGPFPNADMFTDSGLDKNATEHLENLAGGWWAFKEDWEQALSLAENNQAVFDKLKKNKGEYYLKEYKDILKVYKNIDLSKVTWAPTPYCGVHRDGTWSPCDAEKTHKWLANAFLSYRKGASRAHATTMEVSAGISHIAKFADLKAMLTEQSQSAQNIVLP
jgi:nicotinamidase-related amidase